ncbi:MGDG synthase family glycosyltransferase [Laceyella putida]|uniref:Glycosyltransferase n=1 Tax=Laceyella putida TaxID=110101 RepID=A0ABW2RJZ5_9BACL
MKKVLLLTEKFAGNGHYSAALALKKTFQLRYPHVQTDIVCVLPMINKTLESMLGSLYFNTLRLAPGLWRVCYQHDQEFYKVLNQPLMRLISHRLKEMINEYQPNVIICTHVFCLRACAILKNELRNSFKLGAVVTDFKANRFWIDRDVDFYLVAHEETGQAIKRTTPRSPVYATGIPIDPMFSLNQGEKKEIRAKLRLNPDRFTLLLMGGGKGIGPLTAMIKSLQTFLDLNDFPLQLLIVTGNNPSLFEKLKRFTQQHPHFHLYPFVRNMVDLMRASDILISKPGGLTSSEALACGLPILICRPIPGQEENNSRFLITKGAAIREDRPAIVPSVLLPYMADTLKRQQWQNIAQQLGKPAAALEAANIIMGFM